MLLCTGSRRKNIYHFICIKIPFYKQKGSIPSWFAPGDRPLHEEFTDFSFFPEPATDLFPSLLLFCPGF